MRKAFTLIEVLVAISLFAVISMLAIYLYINVAHGGERIELSRELLEESRFTLERIVNEMRTGTVDYAEYWNTRHTSGFCAADLNGNGTTAGTADAYESQMWGGSLGSTNLAYGNCYQFYSASFYENSTFYEKPKNSDKTIAMEHLGTNDADSLENAIAGAQDELYIINAEGTQKTILRRRDSAGGLCNIDYTSSDNSTHYCQLEMLVLDGVDSDSDGKIDTWTCASDFGGTGCAITSSFKPISTPNIHISDLKFFIAPVDDPYKAYNEDIQMMQPRVTIIFTAQTPAKRTMYLRGQAPTVTLQTTVTSRVEGEVTLDNNF